MNDKYTTHIRLNDTTIPVYADGAWKKFMGNITEIHSVEITVKARDGSCESHRMIPGHKARDMDFEKEIDEMIESLEKGIVVQGDKPKIKQLNDDNLVELLRAGKQEGLLTVEVDNACLDELIERFRKSKFLMGLAVSLIKRRITSPDECVRQSCLSLHVRKDLYCDKFGTLGDFCMCKNAGDGRNREDLKTLKLLEEKK